MADNTTVDNAGLPDIEVATDKVTYSGDVVDVQLVRFVQVTGAEGGKTVVDLPGDAANGIDVDVTRMPAIGFHQGALDAFGRLYVAALNNQIDIQFYRGDPEDLTTVTTGNAGTATSTGGQAIFATTAGAASFAKGVTAETTFYSAGSEIYCLFTAAFTGTGAGDNYRRIGLYDTNDGFFLGSEGGTFGFTLRKGGADTQTAIGAWSHDSLVAAGGSLFTRDGTPEAVDLTLLNVWRISFGWVGSAPITLSVLAPDGNWVLCHQILQPNLSALPSIENADLPVTCDVNAGTSTVAVAIATDCWCAGTSAASRKINSAITDESLAVHGRSILAGKDYLTDTYENISSVHTLTDAVALVALVSDYGGNALTVLAAQADNVVNASSGVQSTAFQYVFDGAGWDRARGDATDGTLVNLGANNDVVVSGNLTTVATVTTVGAVTAITNALPVGDNNIGNVDIASIAAGDNNIGNVDIVSGTITTVSTVTAVTAITNALPTGDNNIGNVDIVSVPAPLSIVNGGAEATALRVTIANDSTGLLSVDDNGGALTVDWAGTAPPIGAGVESTALRVTLATDSTGVLKERKDTVPVAVASGGLTTSVTAYTAGDQVGTQFTIANAARASGGTGRITGVTLLDVNDIIGAYDVVIFNATATPATDNLAFSISDADAAKVVDVIQLAGSFDLGLNRFCRSGPISIPYNCVGQTSLFAMLICRFGHTFFTAVTDLTLTVWVERD